MISKDTGQHVAKILIEEIGPEKALTCLERIRDEVKGNSSFRDSVLGLLTILLTERL